MELRLSYILEILEIQQQYQFWWTGPGTEVKLFQIQMFELNLHWYIVIYKLQVLGLWWKYSKIQMLEFIHGLCPHFSGTSGVSTMLDNFHKQDGTLIYHTNIYIHTEGSHPLKILKFYEKKNFIKLWPPSLSCIYEILIQIFYRKFRDKIKIRQNSVNHHQSHPKFKFMIILVQ